MKRKQLFDDNHYLEVVIVATARSFYEEFKTGRPKSEYRPALASGVIQGMVTILEHSVINSGKTLEAYWETERGKKLEVFVQRFYTLCRRQLVFQSMPYSRLN